MRPGLVSTFPILLAVLASMAVPAGHQASESPGARETVDVEGMILQRETVAYKQVDGCMILADVYTTPKAEHAATLVWLHGGALMWGSRTSLPSWQLALYARAGFQLVTIDYRLAPETHLEQIVSDVEDAFRWLRADGPRLGLDPNRVGVIGYSAGGYLALLTGYRVAPRPRALVSMYGYADLLGDWSTKPDAHYGQEPAVPPDVARATVGQAGAITEAKHGDRWSLYLFTRQQGSWLREISGHDPAGADAWFAPFCPLRHVTGQYPPTLLLHGDQDTDVPFSQSTLMDQALARHRVPHELLRMSGYGHAFDRWGQGREDPKIEQAFDRVVEFLRSQLR